MVLNTIFLPLLVVAVVVVNNISCEVSPLLFPSYDKIVVKNNTELPCHDFEPIANANVMVQTLGIIRQVATITCDHGYDIEGNNNIYCVDGHWEYYILPQCIKRCFPPPYLKNGALEIEGEKDQEGYYPKGTLATYSCGQGYKLSPATSTFRVCEKGIWTGAVASCIQIGIQVAGCPIPKYVDNGYFVLEKNEGMDVYKNFDQRLHYICNTGYALRGTSNQQCLPDGSWFPKLQPTCELKEGKKV